MYSGNIIDMHTHIFPEKIVDKAVTSIGNFYGISMCKSGRPSDLIESGSKIGVRKYLVFSTATTAAQVAQVAFVFRFVPGDAFAAGCDLQPCQH